MIDHITKCSWTQPDGKAGYCYHVYYENKGWKKGRHFCYSFNQNLPMSVVNFLLDAANCETVYTNTGKRETFTR